MKTHYDPVVFDRQLDSVQERVRALAHALREPGATEPRSLLLIGAGAATIRPEVLYPRDCAGTLLEVRSGAPDLDSFSSVRQLLDGLVPYVVREAPELLQRFAPEIAAVHPALAAHLSIHPRLPLAQIALTPSERRAHRESEQAFRLINGTCQLVLEAAATCPSFVHAPLVIWWSALHNADRPSLLVFRRLDRWLNQAQGPMLLIGTLDPEQEPAVVEAPVSGDAAHWLDWRAEHRQLLGAVRAQCLGEPVQLRPVPRPRATPRPASAASGSEPVEATCAHAIRQMRQAIFDLNYEQVFLLARRIIAALEPIGEADFDGALFERTWQHLSAGDTYAALEFSVADMHRRRDVLIAAWKATALVHTYMDHHQVALECYLHTLELADSPTMRAQLFMYLGLIAGKRLHQSQHAHDYLARGFAELADRQDAGAALERSWLLNVSALMAYQAGRHAEAMGMVQEALTHLRPYHHSEATHLKVNVVSNISVLLEDSGQLDQALSTWGFFRSFLDAATEIFAKHYQYREGGLRLKAGQPVEALAGFRASLAHASAIDDGLHMEIAARACGYVSHALGEIGEAERWYAQSVNLCEQIGNYERLVRSLLAQALCAYKLGHLVRARALVEQAETLAQRLELPLPGARQAQQTLELGTGTALAEWTSAVLESPGSKLNRPFALTNLTPPAAPSR